MTEDLARRAVASLHWRWMPGMLICPRAGDPAYRIVGVWLVEERQTGTYWKDPGIIPMRRDPVGLPDLTDPATLGCLLALVREAWDDRYLCASLSPRKLWMVDGWSLHDTEAEALVAALEAAP